jgi:hypothetical protein
VLLKASGTLQHIAADRRVEGQLHLINGDTVGCELDRFLDAALPVLLGLAEHARDEIDVDLRKAERLRILIRAENLCRPVRAAVHLENVIVKVLDAKAQPRDAQIANRGELRLGERARLALEGDFFGRRPRRRRRQPLNEAAQLPHG